MARRPNAWVDPSAVEAVFDARAGPRGDEELHVQFKDGRDNSWVLASSVRGCEAHAHFERMRSAVPLPTTTAWKPAGKGKNHLIGRWLKIDPAHWSEEEPPAGGFWYAQIWEYAANGGGAHRLWGAHIHGEAGDITKRGGAKGDIWNFPFASVKKYILLESGETLESITPTQKERRNTFSMTKDLSSKSQSMALEELELPLPGPSPSSSRRGTAVGPALYSYSPLKPAARAVMASPDARAPKGRHPAEHAKAQGRSLAKHKQRGMTKGARRAASGPAENGDLPRACKGGCKKPGCCVVSQLAIKVGPWPGWQVAGGDIQTTAPPSARRLRDRPHWRVRCVAPLPDFHTWFWRVGRSPSRAPHARLKS